MRTKLRIWENQPAVYYTATLLECSTSIQDLESEPSAQVCVQRCAGVEKSDALFLVPPHSVHIMRPLVDRFKQPRRTYTHMSRAMDRLCRVCTASRTDLPFRATSWRPVCTTPDFPMASALPVRNVPCRKKRKTSTRKPLIGGYYNSTATPQLSFRWSEPHLASFRIGSTQVTCIFSQDPRLCQGTQQGKLSVRNKRGVYISACYCGVRRHISRHKPESANDILRNLPSSLRCHVSPESLPQLI
ncbi:hypothetical protein M011DRAFT_267246 [Sporormia fimetaria CBS 119925]|uniref:Uncharacterized protein n=1 Tax=Sporormia fimetaria CBS 119925 TaxID=1340428 RepID=A0A6A6UXN4_9PLEO|nr:hypothetical protein M011DRAFT_267246 [Sporormia fimetaria CBS 119925]